MCVLFSCLAFVTRVRVPVRRENKDDIWWLIGLGYWVELLFCYGGCVVVMVVVVVVCYLLLLLFAMVVVLLLLLLCCPPRVLSGACHGL